MNMLTLKAEALAGTNLRNDLLPRMLDLARRTGCRVEVSGNGTLFWAHPDDTVEALLDAFDRLYLHSRIVAAHITRPVPRSESPEA